MTIGLYDIDLWHGSCKYPKLELMKIYNYCYQNGQKVIMMQPNMDEGRFDKIFYFKEYPSTHIPKTLVLTGEKKKIYGYGFYKRFIPLSEKYNNIPPTFLPYDSYSNKLTNKSTYETMRKSSLIRLENSDFSGFVKDAKKCYIADFNPAQEKTLFPFLEKYPDIKKNFIHQLIIKSQEQFETLLKFSPKIENRFVIDFPFDDNFFFKYLDTNIVLYDNLYSDKDVEKYLVRLATICLCSKGYGRKPQLSGPIVNNEIEKMILKWAKDKENSTSFYEYYKEIPNGISQKLRLLLKTKPSAFRSQSFDFWS